MALTTEMTIGPVSSFRVVEDAAIRFEVSFTDATGLVMASERTVATVGSPMAYSQLIEDAAAWVVLVDNRKSIPHEALLPFATELDWNGNVNPEAELKHSVAGITFTVELEDNVVTIKPRPAGTMKWRDWERVVTSHEILARLMKNP